MTRPPRWTQPEIDHMERLAAQSLRSGKARVWEVVV